MKLKWLSMLLALALVFSLAPAMALAEEKTVTVTDADTLKDAIENPDVTKIKLTVGEYDLFSLAPFTINRNLTIICEGGTAIFKGDPDNANGASNGAFKISGASGVTVTLQGINFENFGGNKTSGNVIIAGQDEALFGGTLNITNCSFSNFGKNGITVKGGTANITGGIINVGTTNNTPKRAPNGIQIDHGATATISGCTIANSNSTHEEWSATGILVLREGKAEISDVKFEKCQTGFMVANSYDDGTSYTTKGSDSKIDNCTFASCSYPMWDESSESEKKTSVTGTSNTWEVSSGAELDVDLINQIPVGTTIKLKDNIELDAMLDIQQDGITLDLNEHTITASQSFPTVEPGDYENDKHLINVSGKNVTIENGTLKTTEKNKHALNVYGASEFKLKNMTLDHTSAFKGAPIVVGASTVTVSGKLELITGTTSWYGMNIDSNIADTESSVTFNEGSNLVFGGLSNIGIRIDDEGTIGGPLSLTFKNMDISVPDGIPDFIVVQHPTTSQVTITHNSSLEKDEDGNYILAQNPEPQPPTPPTSGGGWDDTLWPNILQHPQSVSAPAGSLATFSVVANGGPLSYQWQVDRRDGKGFVPIPGATGATLTVGPVTGAENGYQYRCAVTLYGATMYSGAGQLFVTAGMIPKTGDMPGSPALLLALAGLGLAAWVVARRRAR